MASVQELIREVQSIKASSDQLANMVGAANTSLATQSSSIAHLVQGSRTGQDAVMALSVASRSLSAAASSIKALSRSCDDCIRDLSS
ncbi:hypothetical protein IJG04_00425 [Candidatus Saccharibacteria bacterium]|nr:hypothetical protein [Candidatus Saccharibacteria bacterium]